MPSSAEFMNASEAARRLGVSAKALRLYEQRGLLCPARTEAGWRAYGPREMTRSAEIVALRRLGLSLAQIGRVLDGDRAALEPALASHQSALEGQVQALALTIERIRRLRGTLSEGHVPVLGELMRLVEPSGEPSIAFDLPWPWGGERFELLGLRALTFITGPLGSGKMRLARRLAEAIPGAVFVGLDRLADGGAGAKGRLGIDAALRARVEATLAWMVEDGASATDALLALLVVLEDGAAVTVIDMIEEGLDEATQQAVIAHLRRRGTGATPVLLLTRSSAILDLASVGPAETIILCPANHHPPSQVAPHPGSPGYEAVATCLASPAIRARSAGVVAMLPGAA
jgi:DNA-binding transcriptional MerR regulator